MPKKRTSERHDRTMAKLAKDANALAAKRLRHERRKDRRATRYDAPTPPPPTAQPAPWERQEEDREP